MYKFDISRKDYYRNDKPELKERTRIRLLEMAELGMEEVMTADFGIRGVMSGLYIEQVWNLDEEGWKSYMDWVREMKEEKIKAVPPATVVDLVQRLADDAAKSTKELNEIRATLLVNFGPGNKSYSGTITDTSQTTFAMMLQAFEAVIKKQG